MKPLCDIILLSYESPDLLKKCIQSVLEHTKIPSRLVVVDNASKDPEVSRYLQEIRGSGNVSIEKIFSEENAGFAGGMNKGMRFSNAPFLCLLNNDCVVTEGWLDEMIAIARSEASIGLINPQSNTFGSTPDGSASIDEHALLIKDKSSRYVELGHAIGFACLIKREVIRSIGYLDEAYQGVCYEDTDFSVRAQKAGFISVMAEGAYVFHVEQASRKNLKGKEEIYKKNKKLFERRWGKLLRLFLLDISCWEEGRMNETYQMAKGLARERSIIEMWVKKRGTINGGFKELERRQTIRHADVGVREVSGVLTGPSVLWRVLTKKKKYDALIVKGGLLVSILRLLKPIHGADVFSMGKKMKIMTGRRNIFELNDPSTLTEWLRKHR